MTTEITYEGGAPLTTSPVVGVPSGSPSDGADVLVHETFPSVPVSAQKAGVPVPFAEQVVNGAHTGPTMAGKVLARAGARMSVVRHLAVDDQVVSPAYADMRTAHDGRVTIAQDLTTFGISADAVVTRHSGIDPARWPVLGP